MQKMKKVGESVGDLKFKLKNLKENLMKVILSKNLCNCVLMNKFFQQPPLQIPQMGFSEHNVSLVPDSYMNCRMKEKKELEAAKTDETPKLSDQEVLESTEAIYFTENVDTGIYELKVSRSGQMWSTESY